MKDARHLNLLITEGDRQVIVNGQIDFHVEKQGEVETIHVSDVIHAVALKNLKEQEGAVLVPGNYRLALTVAISELSQLQPPPLPHARLEDHETDEEVIDVDLSELEGINEVSKS